MKKFYNEPEMNISMFEVENVVTSSGGSEPELTNAEDLARAALGTSEGSTVVLTW